MDSEAARAALRLRDESPEKWTCDAGEGIRSKVIGPSDHQIGFRASKRGRELRNNPATSLS